MWVEKESNQYIIERLFEIVNNFVDESELIISEIDNNAGRKREIYKDEGGKALLEIYMKIEERKSEIIDFFVEDSIFEYLGSNIKRAFEYLNIDIPQILSSHKFSELDGVLSLYNEWNNIDRREEQNRHKKNFIYLYTLFENNLLDIINIIFTEATSLDSDKIMSKMHNLGKSDLIKKIDWFSQFKGGISYDLEMMELFICDRNSIIHSSSKYSEFALKKLSENNLDKHKISVGKKVELTDKKILDFIRLTRVVNRQLIDVIVPSFRTKNDRKRFKEEIKKIKFLTENYNTL